MNTKRSIPTLVLQNQWPHLYIPMEAILPEIEKDAMFKLLSDHSENHIQSEARNVYLIIFVIEQKWIKNFEAPGNKQRFEKRAWQTVIVNVLFKGKI